MRADDCYGFWRWTYVFVKLGNGEELPLKEQKVRAAKVWNIDRSEKSHPYAYIRLKNTCDKETQV